MSRQPRGARSNARPKLSDVAVVAADTLAPHLAARALDLCMERCDFGDAILFSDTAVSGRFRHVAIPPLKSRDDYSRFCIEDMPRLTEAPFVLVVQWDGYVVDAAMWSSVFRKFDYVGAPLYRPNGDVLVGNGGFSLRSRRLLDALPELPPWPTGAPEDAIICMINRETLERDFGVSFAPVPIASRFSYEVRHLGRPTFGFHGPPNFWRHESDTEIVRLYESLPPAALTNFNSFGLMVNCLQHDRAELAVKLYRRALTATTAEDFAAEMAKALPAPLARQALALLQRG